MSQIFGFWDSGGFQKIPWWVWYCNVDLITWRDMWNQKMAILRGLPHLDLHLKSAFLHSKMSKVLFSANLLGHCYHSQEPVYWFIWLSIHWAFTLEPKTDTQKKCTTKVQISSHMASQAKSEPRQAKHRLGGNTIYYRHIKCFWACIFQQTFKQSFFKTYFKTAF